MSFYQYSPAFTYIRDEVNGETQWDSSIECKADGWTVQIKFSFEHVNVKLLDEVVAIYGKRGIVQQTNYTIHDFDDGEEFTNLTYVEMAEKLNALKAVRLEPR